MITRPGRDNDHRHVMVHSDIRNRTQRAVATGCSQQVCSAFQSRTQHGVEVVTWLDDMVVEIEFGGDRGDRILCSTATRAGINQEEWLHAANPRPVAGRDRNG